MKPEDKNNTNIDDQELNALSRRGFLKLVGVFSVGVGAAGLMGCEVPDDDPTAFPSMGYILVDSRKCQGCLTCMISCSLVNEGFVNLSLSRIQVMGNHFGLYPNDTRVTQCRQCEDPACVEACPNDALVIDKDNGNIRLVNTYDCIGCGRCVMACPFEPERPIVAPDERYDGERKSRKCDLCLNAPYHFSEEGGGLDGKRTCESVCPMKAIVFTTVMPTQDGDSGYEVNLRDLKWRELGYDINL